MPYKIKNYTYRKAKELGVKVKPSKRPGKKLDVYKNGKLIASVGAMGYGDFPTFKQKRGLEYAKKRQKAYKSRMEANRKVKNTPGYFADKLLW